MLPFQMIAGGTFEVKVVSTVAAAVNVSLQAQNPPDFIICRAIGNQNQSTGAFDYTKGWGQASSARAIEWWWERSMPQYYANGLLQASNASAASRTVTSDTISTLGISYYDTYTPPTFSGLATTAITGSAGTFVVSMANTGNIAIGDYVRLYNTTGELQIAGYTFQVTAVTTNTSITLGYMASSGITFAADATAGTVVKFIPGAYYPHWNYIANITQASQAKVYFTQKNDFTPGEKVGFRVSPDFGMKEINDLQVRVLTVTNSATESSIVLDLDTTGFTAFTFPTSATAAAGVSPAVCVPSSSSVVPLNGSASVPQSPPGTNLQDAFDNRSQRIITFGAGLFNVSSFTSTDGDIWMWQAYKYDKYMAVPYPS